MMCSICGHSIIAHPISGWDEGNNAEPVMKGRCCDICNQNIVIPRRIENTMVGKDPYEGKGL